MGDRVLEGSAAERGGGVNSRLRPPNPLNLLVGLAIVWLASSLVARLCELVVLELR
ncbi:hypothetical protein UFOVP650_42 [uncultured Caudovirales phage]|uniref:Uncharacterized protein n=1 Tax=uncultured Caudovirales phage TaxID=2100421 RepID=A0A6J5NCG2_9CAUD|nr:hypothetical protein UFOVP650_42 [uncultured Caudovirales phage]